MPFLDFCFKAALGPPIVGGVIAMGLAGLTVRTVVGVVEFEARMARAAHDYIMSGGESIPRVPKYPKARVNPFAEELCHDEESVEELPDLLETTEVKQVDAEGKEQVVRTKAKVNRHTRGKFVYRLVCATKNHLGGNPTASRANALVAYKYMAGKCKEHHLVDTHTREVCALAMSAVFTPDVHDVNMNLSLNSYAAYRRRIACIDAQQIQDWRVKLLKNPLKMEAWERAWYWMNGLPQQEAFQFTK